MATFLIERYWPGATTDGVRIALDHLAAAAAAMRGEGRAVRLVRATFAPDDEACLCLIAAPDRGTADELGVRAGFAIDRVSEVHDLPPGDASTDSFAPAHCLEAS